MKFLVDAQLPTRLTRYLTDAGHDALHTSELPNGNRTSDAEISRIADDDERVVITKDRDFRDGHLLHGSPRFLLVVSTGNVSNRDLLELFRAHLGEIERMLTEARFVELASDRLIVHRSD